MVNTAQKTVWKMPNIETVGIANADFRSIVIECDKNFTWSTT